MTIADKPHGRSRYNAGCRCGTCKTANREYARGRRSKHLRAVTSPVPDVTAPPTEPAEGAVVGAVVAQLGGLAAAEERPAMAAIALALARVLDNEAAIPQHAAAAHRLVEVLGALHKGSNRRGRLAAVRAMTPRGTDG